MGPQLEEIRKKYGFTAVNVATWRHPNQSVLPAGRGPRTQYKVAAAEISKPFIPTYKVRYPVPEPTDDEDSGDDTKEEATEEANVDSPMEAPADDAALDAAEGDDAAADQPDSAHEPGSQPSGDVGEQAEQQDHVNDTAEAATEADHPEEADEALPGGQGDHQAESAGSPATDAGETDSPIDLDTGDSGSEPAAAENVAADQIEAPKIEGTAHAVAGEPPGEQAGPSADTEPADSSNDTALANDHAVPVDESTPENESASNSDHREEPPVVVQDSVDTPGSEAAPAAEPTDDRKVSFAPLTPEPKPTHRRKKSGKSSRSKKKRPAVLASDDPPDGHDAVDSAPLDAPPPTPDPPTTADHDVALVSTADGLGIDLPADFTAPTEEELAALMEAASAEMPLDTSLASPLGEVIPMQVKAVPEGDLDGDAVGSLADAGEAIAEPDMPEQSATDIEGQDAFASAEDNAGADEAISYDEAIDDAGAEEIEAQHPHELSPVDSGVDLEEEGGALERLDDVGEVVLEEVLLADDVDVEQAPTSAEDSAVADNDIVVGNANVNIEVEPNLDVPGALPLEGDGAPPLEERDVFKDVVDLGTEVEAPSSSSGNDAEEAGGSQFTNETHETHQTVGLVDDGDVPGALDDALVPEEPPATDNEQVAGLEDETAKPGSEDHDNKQADEQQTEEAIEAPATGGTPACPPTGTDEVDIAQAIDTPDGDGAAGDGAAPQTENVDEEGAAGTGMPGDATEPTVAPEECLEEIVEETVAGTVADETQAEASIDPASNDAEPSLDKPARGAAIEASTPEEQPPTPPSPVLSKSSSHGSHKSSHWDRPHKANPLKEVFEAPVAIKRPHGHRTNSKDEVVHRRDRDRKHRRRQRESEEEKERRERKRLEKKRQEAARALEEERRRVEEDERRRARHEARCAARKAAEEEVAKIAREEARKAAERDAERRRRRRERDDERRERDVKGDGSRADRSEPPGSRRGEERSPRLSRDRRMSSSTATSARPPIGKVFSGESVHRTGFFVAGGAAGADDHRPTSRHSKDGPRSPRLARSKTSPADVAALSQEGGGSKTSSSAARRRRIDEDRGNRRDGDDREDRERRRRRPTMSEREKPRSFLGVLFGRS